MKVKYRSRILLLILSIPLLALVQGCHEDPAKKEEEEKIKADVDYEAKTFLRTQYMDVYYYWRDEVIDRNATLKPYDYDIYDFFDKMLYKDDRWSWMCDKDDFISSETGVVSGTWGVSLAQAHEYYHDFGIRVRYIYPGSPFEPFGVTRGALLTRIGGQNVEDDEEGFTTAKLNIFNEQYKKSPQTFTFKLVDGHDTTFTATMAQTLSTRTTLVKRIFQPGEFPGLTVPVGYFHYLSFKANFLSDIDEAMTYFHDNGVHNVIIDLRYNGGGDSRASQLLVDYLAPKSAVGKPYVIRKHNSYLPTLDDDFSDEANTVNIEGKEKSLELDRLYFIMGEGSASASEMVMNGLKPYMGTKQFMVGDTTYGKPNGMYLLMYPGKKDDYEAYNKEDYSRLKWVFLPIAFFNQNSRGESIPWTGFIPDNYRPDDLYHDFGVEESDINACLTHIVSGTWPEIPGAPKGSGGTKANGKRGYRIDTEEDSPKYGTYTVQKSLF